MNKLSLCFDIRSYWHPGTGRGSGSALDAVTHRGSDQLPALPGRSIKGLLRDCITRAATLGWYHGDDPTSTLFGWRPNDPDQARPASAPQRGCLRFSDATLPPAERDYLSDHPGLLAGLYRSHYSTAIDPASGTAMEASLRGIEVIVPLRLYCDVSLIPGTEAAPQWQQQLTTALPLLRAIGSHRNRGLGRVHVSEGQAV